MSMLFRNTPHHEGQVDKFIDAFIYKDNCITSSAYLVSMSYYYDFEVNDPRRVENELILLDDDFNWYWFNDWDEGQQNVIIYAVYGIDELDLQDNI